MFSPKEMAMKIPIHQRPHDVNPQSSSPLYDNLPAEIRNQIFNYVLVEEESTDPQMIYPALYNRPGYEAKRTMSIALLSTCRRIYLETYHLPLRMKEHIFWHSSETGPSKTQEGVNPDRFGYEREARFFGQLRKWQLELVKEMTLFTQMFWLEQTFPTLCIEDYMQGIEKLNITIRKTDWWWNERNEELAINPISGAGGGPQHPSMMRQDIAAGQKGEPSGQWNMSGWGGAFARLGSLKELEISFEAGHDKKDELVRIVNWAKTWKIPLREGQETSTEGSETTIVSWIGPKYFWSRICSNCRRKTCTFATMNASNVCAERMRSKATNTGPLCHIYTMKWKLPVRSNDLTV